LKKLLTRMLVCFLLMTVLCASAGLTAAEPEKLKTMADFIGKTFSMVSGTAFDTQVEKNEILQGNMTPMYQNSDVDSVSSLKSGKSDAIAMDQPVAEVVVREYDGLMIFPEILAKDSYGFGFQKGNPLLPEFNASMAKLKAEGLDRQMTEKWMGTDEKAQVLISQDWPGTKGTLRFWVNIGTKPMAYLGPEGTPVGFAVDYVLHIAREMDYRVEITECAFDGLIPALQAGKADLAGRCMSITDERKEKIDFSDPFYEGGSVFVVRTEDVDESILVKSGAGNAEKSAGGKGFFDGIATGFRKTFIEQNRWQVFINGLLTTLLITFASMVSGCILGFGLFLLCRKTGKTVNRIVKGITGVIVGIPAVVLLMVLYYVLFGSFDISGVIVSIIAFTLTFGTSVLHMLETGTNAVETGQTEGAYALGYTDNESFFRVILPQALLHILPIFKGELSSLLKATAVVGYIAVQDLTRAGDIIRNRTFEAFFSLISVAVIYYVIGKLLGFLVNLIQRKLDPAQRKTKHILKGVRSDV